MTPIERQAQTTEVLRAAANLIEQGWCQKYAARDAYGNETLINDGDDVEWCALGAIDCAADRMGHDAHIRLQLAALAEVRLCKVLGVENMAHIARWNDATHRTAEEVAEALREAAGGK